MNDLPVSVPARRFKWKLFFLGLGVRLSGVGLIWLGDGHSSLWRKSLVVLGVILTIGGIGVLKYLLYAGMKRSRTA